ncbi:MAG: hypothetical protein ACE1ZA_03220, partial [Pseudomonadales bacterium]
LPEKLELLNEARRVARDGAGMHFSFILPTTGLSTEEHYEVLETGPPFVGVDGDYVDLLHGSGWHVVECQDVTAEYENSLQRLVDGFIANEDELVQVLGRDDLASKREHREDQIALIKRGLLRRDVYVATAI